MTFPTLAELALAGIHDETQMPFSTPWTDASAEQLPRAMASYFWQCRATFTAAAWTLDLAVRRNGQVVGVQGFACHDYLVTRTGETGSWLGRAHQGLGVGTLMRQVICALLFDHLDVEQFRELVGLASDADTVVS